MSAQDFLERLAISLYGKTDKVNAAENDNPDFLAGFDIGMSEDSKSTDAITREWVGRGQPESGEALEKFREWKRGFWAATMQKAWYRQAGPQK